MKVCVVVSVTVLIILCQMQPCHSQPRLKIYIESKCPSSTYFMRRELSPFYDKYPEVLRNLQIVPYGIADCTQDSTGYYRCDCQHGPPECELNQLMLCVMRDYPLVQDHLKKVVCIQGKSDLDYAVTNCLNGRTITVDDRERYKRCARGQEGVEMHYLAGLDTDQRKVIWVPWVDVDGQRNVNAEYEFEKEICQLTSLC